VGGKSEIRLRREDFAVTSPKFKIPRALAMENSKLKTENSKLMGVGWH
jgi:hypothetical protein